MEKTFDHSQQTEVSLEQQITSNILMVRPRYFGFNPLTAENNFYQQRIRELTAEQIADIARSEFDGFVNLLQEKQINVMIADDSIDAKTPDAVFPNNWVTFHRDGTVILYPMFAENRRRERRMDIITEFLPEQGFKVTKVIDFTHGEASNQFLEGTGSLALDRQNKVAYASISDRTDPELVGEFCKMNQFKPITFTSYQTVEGERLPIYHTNVMMCLGVGFAVISLDSIDDEMEKAAVIGSLNETGKNIINLSEDQVEQFAGNMLQVADVNGRPYLVMSTSAYRSLIPEQINSLEKHAEIIHAPLDTIETCGGGSARCMMAEVFLPPK